MTARPRSTRSRSRRKGPAALEASLRSFVEALCSPACAGRGAGTPAGEAARELVADAFRQAGYTPQLQAVPGCNGANLVALAPGEVDRWVLVGAHYDHLGVSEDQVFWGADDNAAGVGVMLEVARRLAVSPPAGRGVVFVAFDSEEPPHYLTPGQGAEQFVETPVVPLASIDLMICMDLVGHALGPEALPDEVRRTLLAMGAERSEGTAEHVDRLSRAVPGVLVRRADIDSIPPNSDYESFRRRGVPFVFLTCGRWRHYHTPQDTPDRLDYAKLRAITDWVEILTRESCARPEPTIVFRADARDDASTLRTIRELAVETGELLPGKDQLLEATEALLAACDANGALPEERWSDLRALVENVEDAMA
ncbi:MAG TPA: M28 family peptidase [Longimicrobiaceae bacterium]|nr:M28 family peptidase [Longimicrobiaceae bacterium]